jgi:hypothetical protein
MLSGERSFPLGGQKIREQLQQLGILRKLLYDASKRLTESPATGPSRMCSRIALGIVQSLADSQPVCWTAFTGNWWIDPEKIFICFTFLFIGMLGDSH